MPHDAGVADVARARSRRRRRRRRCRSCRCTRRRRTTASSPRGRCRRRRRCAPASPSVGRSGRWRRRTGCRPRTAGSRRCRRRSRSCRSWRRPGRCTARSDPCRRRRRRAGAEAADQRARHAAAGAGGRAADALRADAALAVVGAGAGWRRSGLQAARAVVAHGGRRAVGVGGAGRLAGAATPHVNGKHELARRRHATPAPSQVEAGVSVVAARPGSWRSAQGVPCAYSWQAPAAHLPFVSQVAAPVDADLRRDRARSIGDVRARCPSCPAARTTGRRSRRRCAQQTPCAQMPEMHSRRSEQNAPFGFLPHELPTQTLPGEQFASSGAAAEALRCRCRRTGRTTWSSGATQVPVALQVDAGVYTLLSQRSAAQTVPGLIPAAAARAVALPVGAAGRRGLGRAHACAGRRRPFGDRRADAQRRRQRAASTGAGAGLVAADAVDAEVARALAGGRARLAVRLLAAAAVLADVPATQSSSLVQRLMQASSAQR